MIGSTMSKFHLATEHDTGNVYGIKLLDREKAKLFRDRFKKFKKLEIFNLQNPVEANRVRMVSGSTSGGRAGELKLRVMRIRAEIILGRFSIGSGRNFN